MKFLLWRRQSWRDDLLDISIQLSRIEEGQVRIMSGLDDIKANQTKERALVEKLLGMIQSAPAGTFTPEQQAEIDAIVADQTATLGEDPSPATPV